DLGPNRIPARYDALLPIPSAEIVARLERGEGLISIRERPGAPPAILLAAPRESQLDAVEETFAAMTSLPTATTPVALSSALRPEEIRGVVRSARKTYKACYEALLAREPEAKGELVLRFGVEADGAV